MKGTNEETIKLDEGTTEKVWLEFSSKMVRFIKSKGVDENDALDILQNVFLKYELKKNQIRNISGWIYRVARNEINDFHRMRMQQPPEDIEAANLIDLNGEDKESFLSCLSPFLHTMNETEKKVLQAQLEGKSLKKIAAEKQKTYAAIKSIALRGREKLRRKFMACCQVKSMASLKEQCGDC